MEKVGQIRIINENPMHVKSLTSGNTQLLIDLKNQQETHFNGSIAQNAR